MYPTQKRMTLRAAAPGPVNAAKPAVALCNQCHTATHFGLAGIRGLAGEALVHLCTVTGMTDQQARAHIRDAFALWKDRSTYDWILDLNMLTTAGVTLKPPPGGADRVHIA